MGNSSKIGIIAEQKFKLLCLERDIPIFKPVVDLYSIDFVIKARENLISIQVKSTNTKSRERNSYKVNTSRGVDGGIYPESAFDFFAIHIFNIDTWFIIPRAQLVGKSVRIFPDSNKSKYSKYKEAWHLIK